MVLQFCNNTTNKRNDLKYLKIKSFFSIGSCVLSYQKCGMSHNCETKCDNNSISVVDLRNEDTKVGLPV